ncbi:MAG: adenylate/guanylate cyclase domain-containing protein [Opitutaceae bacterium]
MPRSGSNTPAVFDTLLARAHGGLTGEQSRKLAEAQSDPHGRLAAILIVDDDEYLRRMIALRLEQFGYQNVTDAPDGEAALDLIRRQEFDLTILDIEMPRLDGFGVLRALHEDPERRHLPVIVSSGLDDLDAVARCIALGAEDYLLKPLKSEIFRARVSATLERKRLRDIERLRLIQLQHERRLLELEQEKTERLLLNVLPRSIASRLKHGERTIAERYEEVTVLFADVVDFSSWAGRTDPEDLVSLLNDLFSRFDQLAGEHGLEKIKTIGDSYLAVGGLPERVADHAGAAARLALGMLGALREFNRDRGVELSMRIGLNSGPVVAGIIGRRKFTYDLWGATVNVASRMQAAGVPNRIQVSSSTGGLLHGRFQLTPRGSVTCKGVGEVTTFLLDGIAGAPGKNETAPPRAVAATESSATGHP